MWVEILCGLVIFRLLKCFFYDEDVLDVEASNSNALFSVADRYFLLKLNFAFSFLHFFGVCLVAEKVRDQYERVNIIWIYLFLFLFTLTSWIRRNDAIIVCFFNSILFYFWKKFIGLKSFMVARLMWGFEFQMRTQVRDRISTWFLLPKGKTFQFLNKKFPYYMFGWWENV